MYTVAVLKFISIFVLLYLKKKVRSFTNILTTVMKIDKFNSKDVLILVNYRMNFTFLKKIIISHILKEFHGETLSEIFEFMIGSRLHLDVH